MWKTEWLTDDETALGALNFLSQKGRTVNKRLLKHAKQPHGIDLVVKLENEKGRGNRYFITAKGNLQYDGTKVRPFIDPVLYLALMQMILRINVSSTRYNYIYGVAVPESEIPQCIALIRGNKAFMQLKIRLYGVYTEKGRLCATEYLPKEIYS